MKAQRGGFTLIELVVVISIMAVLTAVALPVLSQLRRQGGLTREIASARQMISAHAAYAADHDGDLLPGYGDFPAIDEQGKELHHPVNARYPWRLAPYLRYELQLFWGNEADDRMAKLARGPRDAYVYTLSVAPALGINAAFVGGDYQVLPPTKARAIERYGQFCVTRLAHAARPQQLIVFASAGGQQDGTPLRGYFKIEAPNLAARTWRPAQAGTVPPPEDCGHVDFRWDGRAVAAMLDGHVEMLSFEQMDDMRRWSNQAALADNPRWALGMSEEPAGSGSTTGGPHIDALPKNQQP